jgi:hypothetical protein
MDAASIATGNERRDKSVWSKEFLHVQEYPDMLFVSGRLARDGDRGRVVARGAPGACDRRCWRRGVGSLRGFAVRGGWLQTGVVDRIRGEQ